MKTVYDLKMHEWLRLNQVDIHRVPNGWNYLYYTEKGELITSINVPYTPEPNKKKKTQSKIIEFSFKECLIQHGVDENIVKEFMAIRSKKKATNSETALKGILREVKKSGISANECIKICVEKDWKGFQSDWIQIDSNNSPIENEVSIGGFSG